MHRLIFSFVALLTMGFAPAYAAEEPAKAAKENSPALNSKEISIQMADVWCQKMEECAQKGQMGVQECKKIIFKNFKDGFDNVPNGQKIDVTKETLTQCVGNIKKDTCDSLKRAQNIPSCEFISQLSQGN